ncbi:hypothetical protein, partial [Candidatus Nanosynsacchari sp. TM7_ANC_38.39_G1_1]|uniref:hypothetical protein n=1 Tax=Candidatus Nanosynsacchari sp. TM7_ANC_38.39_G1_1 TaxID=1986206 RepID=UPI0019D62A28
MKQKVAADSLNITFLKANPISILWYDTVVVEMLVQVWRYFYYQIDIIDIIIIANMIRKGTSTYISARLGFTRLFWRVRYWFGWLNFRRLRISFQLRDKLRNTTTEVLYWKALSRGVILPIMLAVFFGFALYVFEQNLPFFININWVGDSIIG